MNDFIYVRRLKDGVVLDIPASDLYDTMITGNFERVEDVKINHTPIAPIIEETAPVSEQFVCPLCSREFKSEHGLKIHKSSHK